jgi:hypothetical protein
VRAGDRRREFSQVTRKKKTEQRERERLRLKRKELKNKKYQFGVNK